MVENGVLEKKLERLKVKTNSTNSNHTSTHNTTGIGELAMPRVLLEDSVRTQYAPTVKILKRPPDANRAGGSPNGAGGAEKSPSRQPVKTLQQREAEYAEARLRILGSARSEDDAQKEKSGSTSVVNQVAGAPLPPTDHVVRQPRGPDQGSNGFQQPRR
ncbi:hypothetical protein HPB47_020161 [Ixodes persulcatus]|uniref:Uncharacterized protein n=1 Tax=Ixodes persulcatus TaxID=34615 RepID=A0AC60QH61_IXOPE|nr:hypothetical protein HPB47_020161 [Ixodes persulcatus]